MIPIMNEVVCGVYINYAVYGEGPPILCLHGWNENGNIFLTSSYRKFLKGHTAYVLDLPGFGKSQALENLNFPNLSSVINAFATQVGLGKFSLLGQCMGGIIALDYTIRCEEKVDKLILVETMIYFPLWLNFMLVDSLGQWILRFMQYRKLGIQLFCLHKAFRASKRNRLSQLIKNLDIRQSLNYIKLMKDYSRVNHLERMTEIKIPVKIIVSLKTFRQVKKTAEDLKKTIDNVKIVRISAKSHFVFEE